MVTVIVSVRLAIYAATYTFNREAETGETILRDVGVRYFYNFYRAFDPNNGTLRQDEETKAVYLSELESILASLDGLSSNPLYVRMAKKSTGLQILASEIRAEIASASHDSNFSIRKSTTLRMCDVFLNSNSPVELPDQDGVASDLKEFAKRICQHLNNDGT